LTDRHADGQPGATTAPGLVEHFFRREYGRLVAVLTRKVGVRHLDASCPRSRRGPIEAFLTNPARGCTGSPTTMSSAACAAMRAASVFSSVRLIVRRPLVTIHRHRISPAR
jgi:hypothetical protein